MRKEEMLAFPLRKNKNILKGKNIFPTMKVFLSLRVIFRHRNFVKLFRNGINLLIGIINP